MTSETSRWQDFVLPVGIIASVLVILVPLPPFLMDILLAANIAISVIVLLTTIYVRQPLEFSIFPAVLLTTTLGRLVLNVATTRLILSNADTQFMYAAGDVIRAFGQFVAGDRLVVGVVMFVIIVIIQFVVITKGATRISEVAARFALDGMPGRQMAIDADLNTGVIDQAEALRRREDLARQADFYGAMDGASKFVRGDAVAGILITLINVAGGLVIGVLQAGMPLDKAAEVYTMLTIGDGLVSQVPALLISLAAALLVTRSTQRTNLPNEFLRQLFSRPQALLVAAGFLGILVLTSLPKLPLLAIGCGCTLLAYLLTRQQRQVQQETARRQSVRAKPAAEDRPEEYLNVDPMEMEIGIALIRLADPGRGGDLLTRITAVRKKVAAEMGIVLPKVRIRDNLRLDRHGYTIKIAGNSVASGKVFPNRLLAMDTGHSTGPLDGQPTRDPAFDQPAYWIAPELRGQAESLGYLAVEPSAVLSAHLQELARRHADELLTRDATRHLIDELRKSAPAAVDELIPNVLRLGEVQQVLQLLLREEVPLRPLGAILESLADFAAQSKDPTLLAERVRQRLARTLCDKYRDQDRKLHVITLTPDIEDRVAEGIESGQGGTQIHLAPAVIEATCRDISEALRQLSRDGHPPILLVNPTIRAGLKLLTSARLPRLVVLSYKEVTRDTRIEAVAMVTASRDLADRLQPA